MAALHGGRDYIARLFVSHLVSRIAQNRASVLLWIATLGCDQNAIAKSIETFVKRFEQGRTQPSLARRRPESDESSYCSR